MKRLIAAISLLTFTSALALAAQKPSGARAEDEAAIRKIVSRIQDAWNEGDSKAFSAPFAEDADYVVVNGMRIKGRATIDEGHRRIFDTIYKGSHNSGSIQNIRFLRDDVAVAHVEWHLKYNENGTAREHKAMATFVMLKEKGEWTVAAFQNTPVTASR